MWYLQDPEKIVRQSVVAAHKRDALDRQKKCPTKLGAGKENDGKVTDV